MNLLRTLIGDFKAWRRGEKRVAPRKAKGRIYRKRKPTAEQPPGRMLIQSKVKKATMSARVIRADGSVEDLGIIANVER